MNKCKYCGEKIEGKRPVCKGCTEYEEDDSIPSYVHTFFDCPKCGKTTELEGDVSGSIEQCEHCKSWFRLSNC